MSEVRLPNSAGMDPDISDLDEAGCYAMDVSDSIAYNNIQLLVRGRIRFSPERLLPDRPSLVSEVRLPSFAGMDPDRSDSDTGQADEYDMLFIALYNIL